MFIKHIICTAIILFLSFSLCYAEKFIYDSKGRRSPFSPPGTKAPEPGGIKDISSLNLNLQVKGIIWDDNEPWAIINDKIVKKGNTISGALVVDIKQEEVTLKIQDEMFVLKIKERKALK